MRRHSRVHTQPRMNDGEVTGPQEDELDAEGEGEMDADGSPADADRIEAELERAKEPGSSSSGPSNPSTSPSSQRAVSNSPRQALQRSGSRGSSITRHPSITQPRAIQPAPARHPSISELSGLESLSAAAQRLYEEEQARTSPIRLTRSSAAKRLRDDDPGSTSTQGTPKKRRSGDDGS